MTGKSTQGPAPPVPQQTRTTAAEAAAPVHVTQRLVAPMPLSYAPAPPPRAAAGGQQLPSNLRSGIESLSGMDMGGVRVHYGSTMPARLNALAYAQGSDIHLAKGQERHLPHEAWHVVQQTQARVQPTIKVAGKDVNDDAGLECEADTLGAASAARGASALSDRVGNDMAPSAVPQINAAGAMQRVVDIKDGVLKGEYDKPFAAKTKKLISTVRDKIGEELAIGWVTWIRDEADESTTKSYTTASFLQELKDQFPKKETKDTRPGFKSSVSPLAKITYGIQTGQDQSDLKPSEENLAVPHRSSFKLIRDSTELFITGKEDAVAFYRWTNRLLTATEERRTLNLEEISGAKKRKKYEDPIDGQIEGFKKTRKKLKNEVESGSKLDLNSPATQAFLSYANSLHGNVPDFGPHVGVNIQVSDRTHLNIEQDGTITPGSLAALAMTPHRGRGVALTSDGKYIVTTRGYKFDPKLLTKKLQALVKQRGTDVTTIGSDDLEEYS